MESQSLPIEIEVETKLLEVMIGEAVRESGRLEKFTDRTLAKLSSVITISSLLTFLSFAFVEVGELASLTRHYLTWVFPYLLLAMVVWVLTLRESGALTLNRVDFISSSNPEVNLQYARARWIMHEDLHRVTHRIYQRTRKLFAISLSLVMAYLVTYAVTFYAFVFFRLPTVTDAVVITCVAVAGGIDFYRWYAKPRKGPTGKAVIQVGQPPQGDGLP